ARAPGVVEADDRRAHLHGRVHDLADLPRVRLRERAAEDGEVLGEDEHRAPVDPARAGDHPVAGNSLVLHAEVVTLMDDEAIDLGERALVAQELDALAGGLLPGLVLAADALIASGQLGFGLTAVQLVETLLEGHQSSTSAGGIARVVR